jgi:hypothetical protein
MRVSETSCSLQEREGGSTVYPFVKPRIVSRYYWNYFRRHSYREHGRKQHSRTDSLHPNHTLSRLSSSTTFAIPDHVAKAPLRWVTMHSMTGVKGHAGAINVAVEADQVAGDVDVDVADDVANDNRCPGQYRVAWGAVRGTMQSCQHLKDVHLHPCSNTMMSIRAKV